MSNRLLLVIFCALGVASLFLYQIYALGQATIVSKTANHLLLLLSLIALIKACYLSANTLNEDTIRLKQCLKIFKPVRQDHDEGFRFWGLDILSNNLDLSVSKFGGWLRLKNYQQPWLLVLGAADSGKSQLLVNNAHIWPDIGVPRQPQIAMPGACEWWISESALFIEKSSTSFYQHDGPQWLGFLKLLSRMRPRKPLDAVLCTIDVLLLKTDADEVARQFSMMRKQVRQIDEVTKQSVPVHLCLTNLHHLEGANEFLRQPEHSIAQTIGFDLTPTGNTAWAKIYESKCQTISENLWHQARHQYSKAQSQEQKDKISNFIFELESVMSKLEYHIKRLTRETPLQQTPTLAGIYFINGVGGSTSMELSEPSRDALASIVIHARAQLPKPYLSKIKLNGTFGGLLLLMLFILTNAWALNAFLLNRKLLADGRDLYHQSERASDPKKRFQALLNLHSYHHKLSSFKDAIMLLYGVGMNQVPLQMSALNYYLSEQSQPLFRQLDKLISTQLEHTSTQLLCAVEISSEEIYQTLKVYLIWKYPERLRNPQNASFLSGQLLKLMQMNDYNQHKLALWLEWLGQSAGKRGRYSMKGSAIDNAAVAQLRAHLRDKFDSVDILYSEFENQLSSKWPKQSLQELLKHRSKNLLVSQLKFNPIYTQKAWNNELRHQLHNFSLKHNDIDWVLHAKPEKVEALARGLIEDHSARDLQNRLERKYKQAYNKHWHDFLTKISLLPFHDYEDAILRLGQIAKKDSALIELVYLVRANVMRDDESVQQTLDMAEQGLEGFVEHLNAIKQDLSRLSSSAHPKRALKQYLLHVMAIDENNSLATMPARVRDVLKNAVADDMSTGLQNILLIPAKETWDYLQGVYLRLVQTDWLESVYEPFEQKLVPSYPFTQGGQDAELNDFVDFFNTNTGLLWSFVRDELEPVLRYEGGRWQARQMFGRKGQLSGQVVSELNRAAELTSILFRDNDTLNYDFLLSPEPSPYFNEISFKLSGQTYRYRNEPQEWRRFQWLGKSIAEEGARISGILHRGDQELKLTNKGIWGLFKILDKAEIVTKDGRDKYRMQWRVGEGKKTYTLSFQLKSLHRYSELRTLLRTGLNLPKELSTDEYFR